MNNTTSKVFNLFSISLFLILFIYLIFRIILVEPIHDEIATLFFYIDYGTFWTGHLDANNHLLNSITSKVFYSLFGDHIWAIRLPNLLSFPIYFYFLYKIIQLLDSKVLRYTTLIGFSCIPFILDYFAYSRGYGMSMAFLVAAIYFFILLNQKFTLKHMAALSIFMILGVYANLNLVITLLLIYGYLAIKYFIESRQNKDFKTFNSFVIISIVSALVLIPAIHFAFRLKITGALYYGNKDGLWLTTGATLSQLTLMSKAQFIKYILIVIHGLLAFHFINQWRKNGVKTVFEEKTTLFIGLLFGNLIAAELMRWILDVNYPEDRVGMHLILFFIGAIGFTLNNYPKFAWFGLSFLLFPILSWQNFNFVTSVFSPDDRIEQQDFDFFSDLIDSDKSSSIYSTQQLAYAHHVRRKNPTDFVVPNRFTVSTNYIEEIVSSKIDGGVNDGKARAYTPIRYNSRTWQNIIERNESKNWILKTTNKTNEITVDGLYYNFVDTTFSSSNKDLKFKIDCTVNTPDLAPETLVLVVDKTAKSDSVLKFDQYVLNWSSGKNRTYRFRRIVEANVEDLEAMKIYLYNPNEFQYQILKQEITIWEDE